MPYKTYQKCLLCSKVIKDLSSHLRLHHGLSSLDRKQYLVKTNEHTPITRYLSKTGSESNELYSGNLSEGTKSSIDSARAQKYLNRLQQFTLLSLYEKKQYIRKRAPDSFILLLRECFRNILEGMCPCDKPLVDQCRIRYSCKRINDNVATHREARNHLCENKMLDLLLSSVIKHLLSFAHKSSNKPVEYGQ